ncbi:hypothetical protein N0V93_008493 [Gnomoniopsis smithogilvyi]|uniref:Alpha/beta-hydrolase n=1 Tax=Gnomoniopsis smithogilvyi TaxID=1191159 RepID=A0A9W8YLU4_9PEZI|nr:hypothetical protein N0V93_008493 [Gnomoniopsis smithogilvyi]
MSVTPVMSKQQDVSASGPAPTSKSPLLSTPDTVNFFGSQIGDESVINYSYTDSPWKILQKDIYYFFYYIWALPHIILPFRPADSGALSELSPTSGNIFCIFVHTILVILQLGFILVLLPLALFIPLWMTILLTAALLVVNGLLCNLLNGSDNESEFIFHSDPQYAKPDQPRFAHEQWVFLNGVAVGSHWMKSNLNRLALTFGRPIVGIHNRTSGIVFDVIECLVQRSLSYATEDIRVCYRIMKEKLYDPRYSKVVFIVHSQGGIEGGLVLDWLLQELPQNLLSKLEVYTFGNAANHFNNPFHTVGNQAKAERRPLMGAQDAVGAVGLSEEKFEKEHYKGDHANDGHYHAPNGLDHRRPPTPTSPPLLNTNADQNHMPVVETPISKAPTTRPARAIRTIEHYAHTTDFVALWGVIHFATTPLASNMIPRFLGRLFAYECPNGRGGHQLVQHYLDGMFPLERDPVTGRFVGTKENGNAFMESYVTVCSSKKRSLNGNKACKREDVLGSWLDTLEADDGDEDGKMHMITGDSASLVRQKMGLCEQKVQVKELSRLWKYRNGRIPKDKPPLLKVGVDGAVRNATL